ncbi:MULTISPECIES: DUF4843 domain-containing protein [Sphingobacterium]|uniref:DUF4843 domain-containing protein n=2 Tax=Sphingobacterium TaxID=28453 RepID=U2J5L8_9SPHI|nr:MULTISPECIES: DUF4843 domain-containing protein [Sphingobacterium]ERJ57958.1 hypothetical protein M472_04180 [Sphingobacterium paucimobilis HER1398]
MNKIKFLYVVFAAIIFYSCKEQSLDVFDESENGASIYFTELYRTGANTIPLDSLSIKFGFMPVGVTSAIDSISVSVAGPTHRADREFKIKIDPEGTLKENIHYQILTDRLIIPAGKNKGIIKLKVLKAEEMKLAPLSTAFELVPNENFNTNIAYRWRDNLQKKTSVLKFRVVADNRFDKPYLWIAKKVQVEGYLGEYSGAKVNLIVELFDEDLEHFINPQYVADKYFTVAKLSFWGSYMSYWLAKEASEGRVHRDENGKEITMGPSNNNSN